MQWELADSSAQAQKATTDPCISLGAKGSPHINYDALFKVKAFICFCASFGSFSSLATRPKREHIPIALLAASCGLSKSESLLTSHSLQRPTAVTRHDRFSIIPLTGI